MLTEFVNFLFQCSPLVASDEDRSYVGLTLIVHITENYPNEVPKVEVRETASFDHRKFPTLFTDRNGDTQLYRLYKF